VTTAADFYRQRWAAGAAAATPSAPAPPEPVIVDLSSVDPRPVRWLWPGWLPEGCLCLLDGDPSLGKSTLTLDLACRVSRGWTMPPAAGREPDLRGPAGVLLLGAEDSLAHTIRPRIDAMGGDPSRIHALEAMLSGGEERPVVLPVDLDTARARIGELKIKLIVVDPLMAYLSSEHDANRDQDVRRCLRPMHRLAEEMGLTILLVRHLNKLSGGPALYRGSSSIGIIGASRASLIVGRDPDVDRHVLAMNKINLGPKPPSLAYRIEGHGMASRLVWEEEVDLRAEQILGHTGPARPTGRPDGPYQEARRLLADLLAGGPVEARRVEERAEKAEVSWRTVEKAKKDLGIISRRKGGAWIWELPAAPLGVVAEGDDEEDDPWPD
jgi:hypothetical protein